MSDDIFSPELLEDLEEGAYCVDRTRRIVSWNSAAQRITGYAGAEAVGNRCWHNLLRHVDDHGHQLCRGWCPLVATMQDGVPREARVYLHHKEGHRLPVQVHARPLRGADGAIIGAVETFAPIVEPGLDCCGDDGCTCDPENALTGAFGLGNTAVRVDRWLDALRRGGRHFGLVRLRIDAREHLAASFDIETCEAIIKAVGATIGHAIRAGDMAARFEDEEFLVLIPDTTLEDVQAQARRLRFLVEQTFLVRNRRLVRVHVREGFALGQPDDSVESLLARAASLA